jgi:hypothetical protein
MGPGAASRDAGDGEDAAVTTAGTGGAARTGKQDRTAGGAGTARAGRGAGENAAGPGGARGTRAGTPPRSGNGADIPEGPEGEDTGQDRDGARGECPGEDQSAGRDAAPKDAVGAPLDGEVTVVPGVARYHRRGCILIRFLSDGDLETMTRREAEANGSVPCKACQPDKVDPSA